MEAAKKKLDLNDIAFYFLMGILGVSILFIVGYLIYSTIFG
jgi:hypothetical protein